MEIRGPICIIGLRGWTPLDWDHCHPATIVIYITTRPALLTLLFWLQLGLAYGAVHKVRHARGGGGPRRCDSL